MDKLKYIKLENEDGSYSESIPLAVDGNYVDIDGEILTNVINKKANSSMVTASINRLETKINSVSSGSPAGVYSTKSELEASDADHEKIYIVSEDGHWYYYNNGWEDGGVYQSQEIDKQAIKYSNIHPNVYNLLNARYTKLRTPTNGNIASYSYNDATDTVNTLNSDARYRFTITLSSGILIKFNNSEGKYKYGVYSNPVGVYTPTYDIYRLSLYNSSWDTLYLNGSNDYETAYRFIISFSDDRVIKNNQELINELINSMEIYQISQEIYNKNIADKTLSSNKILDIKSINGNLPYSIYNVACSGATLTYSNTNYSFLIPVEKNKDINLLINGKFNRCQFALLYFSPEEIQKLTTNDDIIHINITSRFGKKLTEIEENTNPHKVTINTEDYNYLLCYYYHIDTDDTNPFECNLAASYDSIDINYVKPFEIEFNGLKKTDSNYEIFDQVKRNLLFSDSAYGNSHEMQGICTDGTYLYYSMHGVTDNDTSVIGKIRLSDFVLIQEVNEDVLGHVNDICYDSLRNCLYTVDLSYSSTGKACISKIDPETLRFVERIDLTDNIKPYWENYSFTTFNGIGGLTYVEELKIFVALMSPTHTNSNMRGFAILDENFELLKLLKFSGQFSYKINNNKSTLGLAPTVGCIDADDQYIYLTLVYPNDNIYGYTDVVWIFDYNGNLLDENIILSTKRDGINRDFIEGILMMKDGSFYTSNASDRICRYDIINYKHIPISNISKQFNFN